MSAHTLRYSRGGLSLRDRATVAILTALGGREPQLDVHLRAARNVGVTVDELRETIIHTVPYAGFPTAINAVIALSGAGERACSPCPR